MDYIVGVSAATILIIWLAMILSHSQTLQRFGVMELVLMLAVSGSVALGYSGAQKAMTEQYFQLFCVDFGSAYAYINELETNETLLQGNTEEDFAQITGILADNFPITTVEQAPLRYRNLAVVKSGGPGDFQECFFDGANSRFWSEAKAEAGAMILQSSIKKNICYQRYGADGALLVMTDWERITPAYAVVAEISLQPLLGQLDALLQQYVIDGGTFFLAFSLLTAAVAIFQGRELKKVIRMTARVSEGKEDWNRLKLQYRGLGIESNEMRSLYNSLCQIASDIERMNYVKFKVLQAYYRFAPKEIEKVLQKESILDVGHTDRASMEGTLAFVSFTTDENPEEQEYIRNMNRNYALLGEVQRAYNGIILTGNSDLSIMRVMFYEETKKAFAFGVELSARTQSFICLHRTAFVYGVAGDDEQAFTYIHSAEMKILENYMDAFRRMGVRMVVTDYVHEAVGREMTERYIGYIEDGGYTFHIYEVLDAYPSYERHKRIALKPKFKEALHLFYKGDAYLARNTFSEILRDCPTDKVAKWYVFVCENSLNINNAKQRSFALFS